MCNVKILFGGCGNKNKYKPTAMFKYETIFVFNWRAISVKQFNKTKGLGWLS